MFQLEPNWCDVRKWYRPIAPVIAEEALESVFGRKVLSRYMERAPKAGVAPRWGQGPPRRVQPW